MFNLLFSILLVSHADVPDNNTMMREYVPPFVKKMEKSKAKMHKAMKKHACPRFLDPIECDVLSRINAQREQAGLAVLLPLERCARFAREHTQYMVNLSNNGVPLSKSLNHDQFTERVERSGLSKGKVSENVASGANLMPDEVVRMWMRSPGHKQNILDSSVLYTGLAAIKDAKGNIFWTQCFSSKK